MTEALGRCASSCALSLEIFHAMSAAKMAKRQKSNVKKSEVLIYQRLE